MHTLVFNSASPFLKCLQFTLDVRALLVYAGTVRGLSDEMSREPIYAGKHHAAHIMQLMSDRPVE